jgi:MazG family protein
MEPTASEPREHTLLESPNPRAAELFAESVAIMSRLRGPGGCPWDREQSFDTIRKHTLEETYEVLDAIERRDWPNLAEELGDLLLQVLFYAQMGSELSEQEGRFSIAEVLDGLNRKLIRRHPHVFGEAASLAAGNSVSVDAVEGSAEKVIANWEQIKLAEKRLAEKRLAEKRQADSRPADSLLDGVLRAQPALAEAAKIGSKAAKVGFDWPDWRDLLAKIDEETRELVAAVEDREKQIGFGNDNEGGTDDQRSRFPLGMTKEKQIPFGNDNKNGTDDEKQIPFGNDKQNGNDNQLGKSSSEFACQRQIEAELGDLLFTVVNLGRHLGVDGEMALRGSNLRFRQRFRQMEREAAAQGRSLGEMAPEELEGLWARAKRQLAEAGA